MLQCVELRRESWFQSQGERKDNQMVHKKNGIFKRTFRRTRADVIRGLRRKRELKVLKKKELFEERKKQAVILAKKKAELETESRLKFLKAKQAQGGILTRTARAGRIGFARARGTPTRRAIARAPPVRRRVARRRAPIRVRARTVARRRRRTLNRGITPARRVAAKSIRRDIVQARRSSEFDIIRDS